MRKIHVLIDDCRNCYVDIIARTPEAGMEVLKHFVGQIECLYLDHDLGTETSGYDIAKWAMDNGYMPPKVQLVTSNPVGRKNIENVLMDAGYIRKDFINFERGEHSPLDRENN